MLFLVLQVYSIYSFTSRARVRNIGLSEGRSSLTDMSSPAIQSLSDACCGTVTGPRPIDITAFQIPRAVQRRFSSSHVGPSGASSYSHPHPLGTASTVRIWPSQCTPRHRCGCQWRIMAVSRAAEWQATPGRITDPAKFCKAVRASSPPLAP